MDQQHNDDDDDACLSDGEARERQHFAKKKSRSKSLPNNSLLDPRRQTQLKMKLQHLQMQQQQQQLTEDQTPKRRTSPPLTAPLLQVRTLSAGGGGGPSPRFYSRCFKNL